MFQICSVVCFCSSDVVLWCSWHIGSLIRGGAAECKKNWGASIKKKILFLQLGQKNVRETNNGSPLLLFLIFFKEPKIVGKSPLGPLAPLAPLVSAGPGPLYCQSTPFSKSKENMVYILSTLPLYAGVLLKFRIPLCPHCLCLLFKHGFQQSSLL